MNAIFGIERRCSNGHGVRKAAEGRRQNAMASDQGEGAAGALHHQAGPETPGRRGEMALQRPPDALATTATRSTSNGGSELDVRRRLERIAAAAAVTGGPLFLLGTVLHAKRDGWSIAAAGQAYGIT